MFPVKQDRLFDHGEGFFLGGEYFAKRDAMEDFLAPSAADVNFISALAVLNSVITAFAHAAAAVVALLGVDLQKSVHLARGADRAGRFHRTLFAAVAAVRVEVRDQLPDDSKVV
ncbi:hypothetical protein SDC9_208030 [bioreactor metagenome]|uniref:Uncharacterized protein n=1 Tax=bioreactor metagenome TaxID=1076179 RepID=A0A645JB03_9ZZZZ